MIGGDQAGKRGSLRALREQLAALATAASAEAAQRLKQVTVLFLDVVGSTSLSQRLDPEEIHAVMDGALQACTAVVQAHRGLALLDEGRRLGEHVLARHGHAGMQLRVGVHTGPVLLGGGVDGAGTIRGIAVNVAARMEQIAPAGSLRISHDTLVFVRGLFEVDPQPLAVVKGVQDPITSVLVRRALPRPFDGPARGIEGLASPRVAGCARAARAHAAACTRRGLHAAARAAGRLAGPGRR